MMVIGYVWFFSCWLIGRVGMWSDCLVFSYGCDGGGYDCVGGMIW